MEPTRTNSQAWLIRHRARVALVLVTILAGIAATDWLKPFPPTWDGRTVWALVIGAALLGLVALPEHTDHRRRTGPTCSKSDSHGPPPHTK